MVLPGSPGSGEVRPAEIVIEECAPFLHHEMPGPIISHLTGELTSWISIHDQELPVGRLAPLPGALQLAGVEGSVAPATHDDYVPEGNPIG